MEAFYGTKPKQRAYVIYLKGATFSDMLPQFLAICAFSITLNIYAVASFKRSVD